MQQTNNLLRAIVVMLAIPFGYFLGAYVFVYPKVERPKCPHFYAGVTADQVGRLVGAFKRDVHDITAEIDGKYSFVLDEPCTKKELDEH